MQLLNSIKRVSIFANKTTHQIKLKFAGAELNLSAEDTDFADASNERLTCNYDGDDLEIGFNSRFIIEMLNNLDSDEVQLAMSEPSRAGILTPTTTASENERCTDVGYACDAESLKYECNKEANQRTNC